MMLPTQISLIVGSKWYMNSGVRPFPTVLLLSMLAICCNNIGIAQQPSAAKQDVASLLQRQQQLDQMRANLPRQKKSLDKELATIKTLESKFAGTRKWRCNAYNTEHDDPNECANPEAGGTWITLGDANSSRQLEQQLATKKKNYADAQKKYKDAKSQESSLTTALALDVQKLSAQEFSSLKQQYTASRAEELANANGDRSNKNLANDKELASELAKSAKASQYLNESLLRTVVAVESSANRRTGTNSFGYAGLFQMGEDASSDVGYDFNEVSNDWRVNVEAGTAFLDNNAAVLKSKRLPVTALNVYLAHQQGAYGASEILKSVKNNTASTRLAGRNQLNNLPNSVRETFTKWGKKVTVQDYYNYWNEYFKKVDAKVNPQ